MDTMMFLLHRFSNRQIHVTYFSQASLLNKQKVLCCRAIRSQPEWYRKCFSNLTEIFNNHGLKQRTERKTVRFISHFPLKLHLKFGKYFHSTVLCSAGSDYCKKNSALGFLDMLLKCL